MDNRSFAAFSLCPLLPGMEKSTTNSYELKTLGKFYQKPLRRFTSQTRMPTGIRGHRIKRGVALRTHAAGVRTSSY